jgi:hypothetical protein
VRLTISVSTAAVFRQVPLPLNKLHLTSASHENADCDRFSNIDNKIRNSQFALPDLILE